MHTVPFGPDVVKKTIQLTATGHSAKETGEIVGATERTIFHIRRRNKDKIEAEAQRYLDGLPDMVQHDIDEIKDYYEISRKLRDALKAETSIENLKALQDYCSYIDKRITDIKRSIGLYASHAPGLIFQQLNVFSSHSAELSPVIEKLLAGKEVDNDDIIDVTAIPEESS